MMDIGIKTAAGDSLYTRLTSQSVAYLWQAAFLSVWPVGWGVGTLLHSARPGDGALIGVYFRLPPVSAPITPL